MKRDALAIQEADNVATAIRDIRAGEEAAVGRGDAAETVRARQDIPFGHKLALKDIRRGEEIVKYGAVIGRAVADIPQGGHVHVHNVESLRGRGDLG